MRRCELGLFNLGQGVVADSGKPSNETLGSTNPEEIPEQPKECTELKNDSHI